ncbi:hypothetical protein EW145_g3713 [Phellinidium pouzarii]|uniref:Phytocyanin domain-containing protein n=1 Tax=Phellinidium pouzarii TaxID=167371 RepID=A0A4S4L6D4_9AGAM|nr:hypothetical protein EW145_g3713 [Phellinidium pouzarii]
MHAVSTAAVLALSSSFAAAANVFVQVGGNMTAGDNTTTFSPQRVVAKANDIVVFNFSQGTHSATQSTFASPCIPAHDTNITINGFDSGLRQAGNAGGAVTILSVPISDPNEAIWFYDASPGACGSGAVGSINDNENGNATLAGFVRNAERLNGTAALSSSVSATATFAVSSTVSSSSAGSSGTSSAGYSTSVMTSASVFGPLAVFAFGFALF